MGGTRGRSASLLALVAVSGARCWTPAYRPLSAPRHGIVQLAEDSKAFAPRADDTYLEMQDKRKQLAGLSPQEYEEATRAAANRLITERGIHVEAAESSATQTAGFLKQLWNVDSVPALPTDDPTRVVATIYEIGGPLTNVLSTSVAKQLPLIPHVGIRVHGVEYFYSDHIELRTVPVMEEMLGDRPQISLDLGPSAMSLEELECEIKSLEADWTADDYREPTALPTCYWPLSMPTPHPPNPTLFPPGARRRVRQKLRPLWRRTCLARLLVWRGYPAAAHPGCPRCLREVRASKVCRTAMWGFCCRGWTETGHRDA